MMLQLRALVGMYAAFVASLDRDGGRSPRERAPLGSFGPVGLVYPRVVSVGKTVVGARGK